MAEHTATVISTVCSWCGSVQWIEKEFLDRVTKCKECGRRTANTQPPNLKATK